MCGVECANFIAGTLLFLLFAYVCWELLENRR